MPAFHCCFKNWAVGSDDFVPWAFATIVIRGILASLFPVSLFLSSIFVHPCPPSVRQAAYAYNSIGLLINLCILFVDIGVLYVSSRGSMSQTRKRYRMPWIVGFRMAMFIVELLFAIAGTILAWYPPQFVIPALCPLHTTDTILRVVVGLQWFWLAGTLSLYLMLFDPLGCCTLGPIAYLLEDLSKLEDLIDGIDPSTSIIMRRRCRWGGILCRCCHHKEKTYPHYQHGTYHLWLGRLSALACCAGMCNRADALDMKDVARFVSDVFSSTGYVGTDIQAGIVLTTTWQEKHWDAFHRSVREELIAEMGEDQFIGGKEHYQYKPPKELDWNNPQQRDDLSDAQYYFKYAFGVYGWALLMYSQPYTGCCQLLAKMMRMRGCCPSRCHSCRRGDSPCCDCDMAAFLLTTGISKQDVVYSSFANKLFLSPFIVAYDHQKKAVVVAVRGTLSVADAFTDLSIGMKKVHIENEPLLDNLDTRVHKGVYKSAMDVYDTLIKEGVLEQCFNDPQYADYQLVVTGHSLGAAISSVLGLLLYTRSECEQYRDKFKCVAFSNPGCVFSYPLAVYSRRFVLTIVLDNEIIPRMNYHSVMLLKKSVVNCIEEETQPKYKVLYTNELWQCCRPGREEELVEFTDVETETMRSWVQEVMRNKYDSDSVGVFSSGATMSSETEEEYNLTANGTAPHPKHVPAFVPGRVLELVTLNCRQQTWCRGCYHLCAYSFCPSCFKHHYSLYWKANEDYCAVKLIGQGYISCHIPNRMKAALKSLPPANE